MANQTPLISHRLRWFHMSIRVDISLLCEDSMQRHVYQGVDFPLYVRITCDDTPLLHVSMVLVPYVMIVGTPLGVFSFYD